MMVLSWTDPLIFDKTPPGSQPKARRDWGLGEADRADLYLGKHYSPRKHFQPQAGLITRSHPGAPLIFNWPSSPAQCTGDGSNYAQLHFSMNLCFHEGLRYEMALELDPVADFSIQGTNFSNRVVLWGSRGPLASYFQRLRKLRDTRMSWNSLKM